MHKFILLAVAPLTLIAAPAFAQHEASSQYGRDVMSVVPLR